MNIFYIIKRHKINKKNNLNKLHGKNMIKLKKIKIKELENFKNNRIFINLKQNIQKKISVIQMLSLKLLKPWKIMDIHGTILAG